MIRSQHNTVQWGWRGGSCYPHFIKEEIEDSLSGSYHVPLALQKHTACYLYFQDLLLNICSFPKSEFSGLAWEAFSTVV